jgi:hypothetical protein
MVFASMKFESLLAILAIMTQPAQGQALATGQPFSLQELQAAIDSVIDKPQPVVTTLNPSILATPPRANVSNLTTTTAPALAPAPAPSVSCASTLVMFAVSALTAFVSMM